MTAPACASERLARRRARKRAWTAAKRAAPRPAVVAPVYRHEPGPPCPRAVGAVVCGGTVYAVGGPRPVCLRCDELDEQAGMAAWGCGPDDGCHVAAGGDP